MNAGPILDSFGSDKPALHVKLFVMVSALLSFLLPSIHKTSYITAPYAPDVQDREAASRVDHQKWFAPERS